MAAPLKRVRQRPCGRATTRGVRAGWRGRAQPVTRGGRGRQRGRPSAATRPTHSSSGGGLVRADGRAARPLRSRRRRGVRACAWRPTTDRVLTRRAGGAVRGGHGRGHPAERDRYRAHRWSAATGAAIERDLAPCASVRAAACADQSGRDRGPHERCGRRSCGRRCGACTDKSVTCRHDRDWCPHPRPQAMAAVDATVIPRCGELATQHLAGASQEAQAALEQLLAHSTKRAATEVRVGCSGHRSRGRWPGPQERRTAARTRAATAFVQRQKVRHMQPSASQCPL
jgi:hypothetical protein